MSVVVALSCCHSRWLARHWERTSRSGCQPGRLVSFLLSRNVNDIGSAVPASVMTIATLSGCSGWADRRFEKRARRVAA